MAHGKVWVKNPQTEEKLKAFLLDFHGRYYFGDVFLHCFAKIGNTLELWRRHYLLRD
jgi:hypothetical protein